MNVKATKACVGPLAALGFTELESLVYAFLVQESPATGYRVAQAIGKPVANTYQAIQSLQRKGAVMADETGSKQCRAVAPDELLQQLRAGFRRSHQRAAQALADLRPASGDDGVYALTSVDLVFERCHTMLAGAREVGLIDIFPRPLAVLRPAIEAAAARGVALAAQVYESTSLVGVETVRHAYAEVTDYWPGHWLNVVVDGAEVLLAFLAEDGEQVHQALWSRSPFLCWAYQGAVAGEMLAARLQAEIGRRDEDAALRVIADRFARFRAHESPGYQALAERFGWSISPEPVP